MSEMRPPHETVDGLVEHYQLDRTLVEEKLPMVGALNKTKQLELSDIAKGQEVEITSGRAEAPEMVRDSQQTIRER